MIGDKYFQLYRRGESAKEAIFTRKVGHTQRGGRPILFDRFYAAQQGAKAVELLVEGRNNAVSVLQYNTTKGFYVEGYDANRFRDRWGLIHARKMHPSLYDREADEAVQAGHGLSDADFHRRHRRGRHGAHAARRCSHPGNLSQPYHSINTDVHKRIRYLETEAA